MKTSDKKILATFDVTNMYTNIDNNLGQEAIRFWLEKHPELIPRNISKDYIYIYISNVKTHQPTLLSQ